MSVLVVGEALVDIVRRADGSVVEHPGGSPANVALTLGRLGCAPRLLTSFGDDERGAVIRAWLEESHVDVVVAPAERTSTAEATLDATGAATYVFDLAWDLGDVDVQPADVLHVGSISAVLDPGGRQVADLVARLRPTTTITYDPNARPALMGDHVVAAARVGELVALADVVKVSDEDLAWFHPDQDPMDTAADWLTLGPALVVVTTGGEGATVLTPTGFSWVVAPRVDVVDTVGAGDTFMGALIDGLVGAGLAGDRDALRSIDPQVLADILARCARAAAITVSRSGANPPWAAELD
ncbi:carbohydrate kinase family protein [Cellulomonas rhizosphaerae]|uniref:Carbohydrate kinase n=1 Tax=Cellulomonas rhizosphaerae TaxID=2293719 RepID=A0A413RIQ3_9CELL|nr:carbohydrate kinase [Cellulomonas rhizosphaerae]RHA38280.1 carbohydrate kinase [Cellulomonas rhizosphaerae]